MAFDEELEAKWEKGKRLTILSIDGGGVRGIIPARILQHLEDYLNQEEGETTHHLYEYFDVIAGTSSGGLITALITIPGDQNRPCNAKEVVAFFKDDAVKIFPKKFSDNFRLRWLQEGLASLFGSIYSAEPLKGLLDAKFGHARLSAALTSVIIPAFDTNDEVPVFFSNLKEVDRAEPLYNVQVKDACRATTALPIFFPAANFKVDLSDGSSKEFNVIDGGIAVNDPTLVAVTQAIVQERQAIVLDEQNIKGRASEENQEAIMQERSRYCTDFRDVLVLSLGTGQHRMRFLPKPHWTIVQWLLNASGSPLLNSFLSASQDIIEYYTSMILFDARKSRDNYLRIQADLSTSEFWGIDNAKQLEDLLKKADDARLKASTRVNNEKTALRSFAERLVEERRHTKNGKDHDVELNDGFGRTRRRSPGGENLGPAGNPSDGIAVQTAVDPCRLRIRTAVGACCLICRAIMLFVVFGFFYFFYFGQVIFGVFYCKYWKLI